MSHSTTKPTMYVIKRNQTHERVNFDKILTRIEKLCYSLNTDYVDPVTISKKVIEGLYTGVSTSELDNLASETCAALSSTHPDYGKLAARIFVSNLHKQTDKLFSDVVSKLYHHVHPITQKSMPLVSEKLYQDMMKNRELINSAVIYNRDYTFSYFGLKTLEKAYLLRINDIVVERPQHLFMRVSIALHEENIEKIIETYNALSMRYFIHATPTLFNAGTMRAGLSSCFLITATK